MAHVDDERILDTLAGSWRKAVRMRFTAPEKQAEWWEGFVAGQAVAIAVVSGTPPGGMQLDSAIRFGCEIARIRSVGPLGQDEA